MTACCSRLPLALALQLLLALAAVPRSGAFGGLGFGAGSDDPDPQSGGSGGSDDSATASPEASGPPSGLHPVILVPGLAGSQIRARLHNSVSLPRPPLDKCPRPSNPRRPPESCPSAMPAWLGEAYQSRGFADAAALLVRALVGLGVGAALGVHDAGQSAGVLPRRPPQLHRA